jgi:phosphoribosyl 1,2-cyclic phosphodiesterase
MMELITFASGSTGNCALVSAGRTRLLIDAGISFLKIKTFLNVLGCAPEDLSGVLVTHEHSDHIKGLSTLAKRTDLPIFAPRRVTVELWRRLPETDGCVQTVPVDTPFFVGDAQVAAFETPHDTPQSVGYRIGDGSNAVGICTDLGHVPESVRCALSGVDAALIEANHDVDRLKLGPYPIKLKRRILSDRGHLRNEDCGDLAVFLARQGAQTLVLGHISKENNTPDKALAVVGAALETAGYGALPLLAAPAEGILRVPVKGGERCLL